MIVPHMLLQVSRISTEAPHELVSVISLGAMLIGLIGAAAFPRQSVRWTRSVGFFSFGAAMLLAMWLMENPQIMTDIRTHIGLAALGAIIVGVRLWLRP